MAECFLSYSHTALDQSALSQIQALLAGAGVSYWYDGNLRAQSGVSLNDEIGGKILESDLVIILISSQYISSRYCQAEAAFAFENDKKIIRVDIEPCRMPASLLPLTSAPGVTWHGVSAHDFTIALVKALASCGVDASHSASSSGSRGSTLDLPDAALVRPSYPVLKSCPPDRLREIERRLTDAQASNPRNGYNHLSLAYLWLYKGDTGRALAAARAAAGLLGHLPDAHFAEALALCTATKPAGRSKQDVEEILRRLAIARRLPKAGAHIDLLSAIVISNYYLPNYLTPPAAPDDLLRRGLSSNVPFDKGEVSRVLETEPVVHPEYLPNLASYIQLSQD